LRRLDGEDEDQRDATVAKVDINRNGRQEGMAMNASALQALDHDHRYTGIHTVSSVPVLYRQLCPVFSTGGQLCHIKNKVRHETSLRDSMKQERVPPQRHRGLLRHKVGNVELFKLQAQSGAVFVD